MTIAGPILRRASSRLVALYAGLLAANAVAWLWALAAFHGHPVLIGAAGLAYIFGLRHALDADHIAAIDNVVRRMTQPGRKPLTIGLYFSLGHSTVVVLACVGIAMISSALRGRFAVLRDLGAVVGTGVSATFLLLIALANVVALFSIYRVYRGGCKNTAQLSAFPTLQPGPLGWLLRPLIALIAEPWHMYPLGFLFGLGFDTATEIGLLSISASQASQNISLWSILVFPALFTAGMTLVDTTDGVAMAGAYGWAFIRPMRKLAYNLAITFVSVVVAIAVGALETLNLLADRLSLNGGLWRVIGALNDHFGAVGLLIVLACVTCWAVSAALHRRGRNRELNYSSPPSR